MSEILVAKKFRTLGLTTQHMQEASDVVYIRNVDLYMIKKYGIIDDLNKVSKRNVLLGSVEYLIKFNNTFYKIGIYLLGTLYALFFVT